MTTENKVSYSTQVPSPCVRNCCLDENDVCMGCGRHIDEILVYGTDKEKRELFDKNKAEIMRIQKRLEKLAAEERVPKRRAI